ncbi:MAG: FHA domain-containing protein [Bacteroidales bacterium]|nr:FHA domain-containing protein [Bacteroidales bacterium]
MKIITIGRSSDNNIIINDSCVSRHHCKIILENGQFRILDNGSTCGIYVNGKKINGDFFLKPNDTVRIGNTTLPWRNYFPNTISEQSESFKKEIPNIQKNLSIKKRGFIVVNRNIKIREEVCQYLPCCKCGRKIHISNKTCVCFEEDPFYFKQYYKISGAWIMFIIMLSALLFLGHLYTIMGTHWAPPFIAGAPCAILLFLVQFFSKKKREKFRVEIEKKYVLNNEEYEAWNYYLKSIDKEVIF